MLVYAKSRLADDWGDCIQLSSVSVASLAPSSTEENWRHVAYRVSAELLVEKQVAAAAIIWMKETVGVLKMLSVPSY